MWRLWVFLLTVNLAFSQTNDNALSFPDAYLGSYSGELEITGLAGFTQVNMNLTLAKTDSVGVYQYHITYGDQPTRAYLLKTVDLAAGKFIIDEQNDIVLDASFSHNTLSSVFEVMGNLITTNIIFTKGQLDYQIFMVKFDTPNLTGGTSEQIPQVRSFPITVNQRALLIKD